MQLKNFLPELITVVAMALSVVAWVRWYTLKPPTEFPGWRRALTVVGLAVLSFQIVLLLALLLYSDRIGGFGTNFRTVIICARIDFYLTVFPLLAMILGKRGTRVWILLPSLLVAFNWFGLVMAM